MAGAFFSFLFFFLRTSGSGALASTPQARWATGQYSNKLGSQGVPRPTLRAGHSSLLLPLLVSPVCQGWREAGAASLLVCVVGVACVSFLVFGPIAVLLTLSQLHLGPVRSHFVLLPTQGRQPGIGRGKGRWCWPRGEGLSGWMECRYVAYRDIYFIMGGGTAPPETSRGWEVCCQAHGPETASLERWGL